MTDIDIKDITPAELRAIQDHKYFMSQERGKEVTIEEAIRDFLEKYMDEWRLEKVRNDNMEQVARIRDYMAKGGEIEDWSEVYAPVWRQERESLQKNQILGREVIVQIDHGLHVRPSGKLVTIAKKFDCEIYVHRTGMQHHNFKLQGKPFMNVKSVLAALELVSMCVAKGEKLEFLAYGKQAEVALDAIERLVNSKTGDIEKI
jgi:phosphotransferase system HPr (HPr) family protein